MLRQETPSWPPTAYRYPPSTATPTLVRQVLVGATSLLHWLVLGSYLIQKDTERASARFKIPGQADEGKTEPMRRLTSPQSSGRTSRRDLPLRTVSHPKRWRRPHSDVCSLTPPSATRWSGGHSVPRWKWRRRCTSHRLWGEKKLHSSSSCTHCDWGSLFLCYCSLKCNVGVQLLAWGGAGQ